MKVENIVYPFVQFVIESANWTELDKTYLTNKVLYLVGEKSIIESDFFETNLEALDLVEELIELAVSNKKIQDTEYERECLCGQLMELITPTPSEVNAKFHEYYQESPQKATEYFFDLSKKTDYIKTRDIAKNIEFPVATEFGDLEITINLSRPEKDPKQIVSSMKSEVIDYPKCMLCMENEGYSGREGYPNRFNHRIIRTELDNEKWGFQYSPYAYFNEHAIVLSEAHQPMKIERKTFERLMTITKWLPHYFVGSNADLPIVGGSILSHDHYQTGRFTFPIEKSSLDSTFSLPQFPSVKAGRVKWPMSVIRISSENSQELVEAACFILEKWQSYSDENLDIVAETKDGIKHHTITPIARRRDGLFEFDLVLRDNNVSEEFPDGIFHPHQELHHIKKENIGLIEVMGLAILPPRLHREMNEVKHYLLDEENQIEAYHLDWTKKIKSSNLITKENVQEIINKEIGLVFLQVLKDAGVYKRDEAGQAGFQKFINYLLV